MYMSSLGNVQSYYNGYISACRNIFLTSSVAIVLYGFSNSFKTQSNIACQDGRIHSTNTRTQQIYGEDYFNHLPLSSPDCRIQSHNTRDYGDHGQQQRR